MAKGFLTNRNSSGKGSSLLPQFIVTGPAAGSTVTCTNGSVSIEGIENNGEWIFEIPDYGTWEISSVIDGYSMVKVVDVNRVEQYSVDLLEVSTTLSENNWGMIARVAEAGEGANYWSVGDEITVPIADNEDGSTTDYQFRIIGFNHDTKSDGSGKNGITFQMVDCLNSGTYERGSKIWGSSDLRTTLNSTIFEQLPSDLQTAIKTVDKTSCRLSGQGNSTGTSQDKLFILGLVELLDTNTTSEYVLGEGKLYSYWKNNDNDSARIKKMNGSATYWLLRTIGPTLSIYHINTYGSISSGIDNGAISFAFVV